MIHGNLNINGASKGKPYPTAGLQAIVYDQTYEDGGTTYLRTSTGVGIPLVSGTGLDAIWDFSVLNDVRLDKSNATYWGASLDAYFYYDALNPYHGKLKDFHYRFFQNQMASDNNFAFLQVTVNVINEITSANKLLIYNTEQTDNNLYALHNYIGVFPISKFDNTTFFSFIRTNFEKAHTIEFYTQGINKDLSFQTILGDTEFDNTGIVDRFRYLALTSGSFRYQTEALDGVNTPFASRPASDAITFAVWKVTRNGTNVEMFKNNVSLGTVTLAFDLDIFLNRIGAVKDIGIPDAGNIFRVKIYDGDNNLLTDWASFSDHAAYDISGNNFHAINNGVIVEFDYSAYRTSYKTITKNQSNIVCKGDSLTDGLGAVSGQSYPDQLSYVYKCKELLDTTITNKGVSGERLLTMISNASTEIDVLFESGVTDTLIFWGGANDLIDEDTSANIYAKIKQYCQDRKNVGWKVFVCEILDSNSAPNWTTKRNEINSSINSDLIASGYIDGVVNLSDNSKIGYDGAQNDTQFFIDGLHLTVRGYLEVAQTAYNITKTNLTILNTSNELRVPSLLNVLGYN